MLIDWFTVVAQAFNFLVLVWLMKLFLYKPILDAIDAREKRIASALAEADATKAAALEEKIEFQHRKQQFDQQRAALLDKAADEAKADGRRLLTEARLAAEAYSAKRQEALQLEQQSLNDEIIRRTREEVYAIARKTLRDLADASLEERLSVVFRRRLGELNNEKKKSLAKALKTTLDPVLVRSAFLLPAEQRGAIQQALNETFSAEIKVHFETAPEVISGIELTANGQKIAWSITEYLTSLERSVGELLQEQSNSQSKLDGDVETEAESKSESGAPPAVPKEAK